LGIRSLDRQLECLSGYKKNEIMEVKRDIAFEKPFKGEWMGLNRIGWIEKREFSVK